MHFVKTSSKITFVKSSGLDAIPAGGIHISLKRKLAVITLPKNHGLGLHIFDNRSWLQIFTSKGI